ALTLLRARLQQGTPAQVCFVNADCVNLAFRNPEYRSVLQRAGLAFADGIGVEIAARLQGRHFVDNVNGTDMFPRLCAMLERSGHRIFLLGARPGVAEETAGWIRRHHPNLPVAGVQHGYFERDDDVVRQIKASGADVLLVGMGAPRQDLWIARHLRECGVTLAMGVGGLFDFYSGRIPRAPAWMRSCGLEWVWRLYQEPGRMWRRYLIGNLVFLARALAGRAV
ncbi:MAG: WecB/TagA/CpsF family glycosyltransferase, partial [Candidatus Xenobia bacterium]